MLALSQENHSCGYLTRSDTNQSVQSQKMAKSLKLWLYEEDGLYYLRRENIDADQLCSYCTADVCLCFCMHTQKKLISCDTFHISLWLIISSIMMISITAGNQRRVWSWRVWLLYCDGVQMVPQEKTVGVSF